jgi:predicted SAM-dependent methyltransferase
MAAYYSERDFAVKLEIGCGQRPTPGYLHNDLNAFEGVEIVGSPWEISIDSDSLEEVLALGVIEHLTYEQVSKTFVNVNRMLQTNGVFVFDVPDIPIWCEYVVKYFRGEPIPFSIDHVFATLYGWQRWPGDEHKSGWYPQKLLHTLEESGFTDVRTGVEELTARGHVRNRMSRPHDAHIYCVAIKN